MQKIPEPLEMPRRLETLHRYVQGTVCANVSGVRDMLADGDWPCQGCDGRGTIYDPNDPPCPIEGNKMRGRVTCTRCGGSGYGERSYWEGSWGRAIALFAKASADHDLTRAVMRQALDKLTAEEAAALGWEKP